MTKTTKTTKDKKTESIENSVAKCNIRSNISRQIEDYLSKREKQKSPLGILRVASLAAETWLFENSLKNNLEHSLILKNAPEMRFISAERKKQVANQSYINMPLKNATVVHGVFSDIFTRPFKTSLAGYSYFTTRAGDETIYRTYDLVWADYCCYASTELLNDFVHVAQNNIDKGFIYLTFCISKKRGKDRSVVKDLKRYSKRKTDDIIFLTVNAITHFAKKIKGKKLNKVFEVIYGGGSTLGTTMVTVGYSVGLPENIIKPLFFDDSEWMSADVRKKRQCIVSSRLNKHGGWNCKKVGRPKKGYTSKVSKKTLIKRLEAERNRLIWESLRLRISLGYDKGQTTNEIYNKLKKELTEQGLTKCSVSSVKSWRSPKLAKKKVKV